MYLKSLPHVMSLDFYSIKTPSCFFIAVFACYSVCINQKFWFRIDYDCCAEDKRKQCVFVCSLPTLADPSQLFWHSDDLSEILKYIMIKCKLSFPQSFSTVLTTRHDKEGMIKRKDNVTTWSWRWFFSYLCGKCFVFLLVWNMWTWWCNDDDAGVDGSSPTCVEYVDRLRCSATSAANSPASNCHLYLYLF